VPHGGRRPRFRGVWRDVRDAKRAPALYPHPPLQVYPMRILLTTTSYQDTPGPHHAALAASGFEVVRARGPLPEADMLKLVQEHGGFDGFLNGDDHITAQVIDAALAAPNSLKVIAKYGIGL